MRLAEIKVEPGSSKRKWGTYVGESGVMVYVIPVDGDSMHLLLSLGKVHKDGYYGPTTRAAMESSTMESSFAPPVAYSR